MIQQSVAPTRLPHVWLWPARLAWFLILLLALWKLILGTPLIYAEKLVVCTASAEVCAEGISPSLEEIKTLAASGISQHDYAVLATAFRMLETVVWVGVGILIFCLRSDDWLALIASAMMILFTTGYAGDPIIRAYPDLGWLAQLGFSLQNVFLLLFVGLFPSGRFAPRWLRGYWMVMVALALFSDFFAGLFPVLEWLWLPFWLSFLILGPYSQIYRYFKVSTPTERLQTRWVVFGFAAMAAFILVGVLLEQIGFLPGVVMGDFFFGLGALALPLSIGVSVLRYRLWDVEVIIRRTLVYGALTIALILVYFGSVVVIQGLLTAVGGRQTAVVTVISTLLIAALFTPLRQEVDLEELSSQLLMVVEETLQPEHVSVWLRESQK